MPMEAPAAEADFDAGEPEDERNNPYHDELGRFTNAEGDVGGAGGIGRGSGEVGSDDKPAKGPRLAQAEIPGYRVDLLEHEGKQGAHAIAEHVGRSDAYLLARARGERGPVSIRKRVGSFPSMEAANKLVSATLSSTSVQTDNALSNRERTARVARGDAKDDFITLSFGSKTGREAYAPSELAEPYLRDTDGVGVLIIHDPKMRNGLRIQTAYPRSP